MTINLGNMATPQSEKPRNNKASKKSSSCSNMRPTKSSLFQSISSAMAQKHVDETPDNSVSSIRSAPSLRGCMSVRSLEESLHSKGCRRGRRHSSDPLDQSRVGFDKLEIREYPVELVSNPSVSSGPAIGIGWDYDKSSQLSLDVDEYEESRPPRRYKNKLLISARDREERLKESGYSRKDMVRAIFEMQKEKRNRNRTTNNLNNINAQKMEEAVESAGRKLKRIVLRKKKDDFLYEEWKREKERADAAIEEECRASAELTSTDDSCTRSLKDTITVLNRRRQGLAPIVIIEDPSLKRKQPLNRAA